MTNTKILICGFFILLCISSCSSFPADKIAPGYQEAFSSISKFISGYEESIVSKELIEKIPQVLYLLFSSYIV